jgi:hypothetical protein
MSPDPREERLPKWAQFELMTLRATVRRLKARNAELRGEIGETNTHVLNFGDAADQPLQRDARVQFSLGEARWDEHVQAYIANDRLQLQGGRPMIIIPNVSNSITIMLRKH